MKKIVLFGAGAQLQKFLNYCKFNVQMQETEIIAICDNDSQKHGKHVGKFTILHPNILNELIYDGIVITTQYVSEIREQLISFYGVKSKIHTIDEYIRLETIAYNVCINEKRNRGVILSKEDIFNSNSLVIYTAIIGDYDELKDPEFIQDGISYVCFTDNPRITSDIWDVRYVVGGADPRQVVREYKVLPHKFLSDYETSIWIDASFTICGDLVAFIMEYQKHAPMLLFPHYERICIYDEAAVCISNSIEEKEVILRQINQYYNEGYPLNEGLVCGGFLVRQHHNLEIQSLMEEWWKAICDFSKRDQISLPYLMKKNNIYYDLCDLYIQNNVWIKNNRHKFLK